MVPIQKNIPIAVILSLLMMPPGVQAEETPKDIHSSHQNQSTTAIEHVEITLPQKILPDLPAIDAGLSMEEAVTLGLENNLGIRVAGAEVAIRRSLLRRAKAEQWPVISLGSLTFLRGGDNLTLMTPDIMMNTVDSTLFQDFNATGRVPLFTGGRIRAGIRAARFDLAGTQASLKQTTVETAYQIRQAYLQALLSQVSHRIHQLHIQVQQELLRIAEARYRVGRGLRADVLRIQAELADARRELNEEHQQLNNAMFDLKAAMGADLGSNLSLTEQLSHRPWTGPQLAILVQAAVNKHPRIQEAENRVKEAEAQVRVAQAAYLPQIYGQVTGNLRIPDRPIQMGNGVIGMMTASLPVFDRNRDTRLEQAKATLNRTKQTLKALQLEIGKDIAKAWSELEFANQNVALAVPAVQQAQEDLRLIQRRFEVGRAINVEVQDAALTLREAQLNQATAIFNHELAKAKLLQTTGKVSERP